MSYSVLHSIRSDQHKPNWFQTFINSMLVQDEVQLIQLGA